MVLKQKITFFKIIYTPKFFIFRGKKKIAIILLFVGRSYFPKWCATENASFILYLFCHLFVVESSMDS